MQRTLHARPKRRLRRFGLRRQPRKVSSAKRPLMRARSPRPAPLRMRRRASCARWQIAWPRLSRTELIQVAQAGRPGDPREREQDIFENLSKICLCGGAAGSWDRPAMFSKIFQKFACVNRDLPCQNLPLLKENPYKGQVPEHVQQSGAFVVSLEARSWCQRQSSARPH